ncbi:MAG: hypothetical protein ACI9WL_000131 [Rubritalea sp.]|jgi:hypothetical protein
MAKFNSCNGFDILKAFRFSENLADLFFLLLRHKFSSIAYVTVVNFNAEKRKKKEQKIRKSRCFEYIRSKMYSDVPHYLEIIELQSGRFEIENTTNINSVTSDFGPAFYRSNKQVVFSTARDTGSLVRQRHTWNMQSFL